MCKTKKKKKIRTPMSFASFLLSFPAFRSSCSWGRRTGQSGTQGEGGNGKRDGHTVYTFSILCTKWDMNAGKGPDTLSVGSFPKNSRGRCIDQRGILSHRREFLPRALPASTSGKGGCVVYVWKAQSCPNHKNKVMYCTTSHTSRNCLLGELVNGRVWGAEAIASFFPH